MDAEAAARRAGQAQHLAGAFLLSAACGGADPEQGSQQETEPACTSDTTTYDPDFAYARVDVRSGDLSDLSHDPDAEHIVLVPEHRDPLDSLFVWLPGTGAQPSAYEDIQLTATFAGYRTIGLAYANDAEVANRCEGSDDPDCSWLVRTELQGGEDVSDHVDVGPDDSIDARLADLLRFVAEQRPDDGWDDFLLGESPDWSRITIAGHSQGGGQTAFISHQHEVVRGVHFSNPGDRSHLDDGSANAPWTTEPRATPGERLYLLFHMGESSSQRAQEIAEATGMAAYGDPVLVDSEDPPYGCAHVLITDTPADSASEAHRTVAADGSVPRDDAGVPEHTAAWLYMFTAEPA